MALIKDSPNSKIYEQYKKWIAFYRNHPDKFAEDYLGLKLFPFQKFLLRNMVKYNRFCWIGSRGIGGEICPPISIPQEK